MNDTKVIVVNVLLPVSISVNAYRDESGDVQIESVRNYIGLPSPTEIYESMDTDAFDEMDASFAEVEQ